MQRIYVPLRQLEVERLIEMASDERRRPQDQAAHLIAKALTAQHRSTAESKEKD
jgi:hypothetical protein